MRGTISAAAFIDILPIAAGGLSDRPAVGNAGGKEGCRRSKRACERQRLRRRGAVRGLDLWRDPAPWLLLSCHGLHRQYPPCAHGRLVVAPYRQHPQGAAGRFVMFLLVDEVWALAERRALSAPLTAGLIISDLGCRCGQLGGRDGHRRGGRPRARRSAGLRLRLRLLGPVHRHSGGFWKGPRTGAVLAASGRRRRSRQALVPGAWYIALGGIAGVSVAALLAQPRGRGRWTLDPMNASRHRRHGGRHLRHAGGRLRFSCASCR